MKRASAEPDPPAARRRLEASSTPPEVSSLFVRLSDEERQRVFSFLASISGIGTLSMVNQHFRATAASPAIWEGVKVVVDPKAFLNAQRIQSLVALGTKSWGLAAEVVLPANPMRLAVVEPLQSKWPRLTLTTVGEGPHSLFVMGSANFPVGEHTGLHFFEPRYRWMCRRIFDGPRPYLFGFVTSGGNNIGATGSLCEVITYSANDDGTYDTMVCARRTFTVLERWTEQVPGERRVPPLSVGYLKLHGPYGGGSVEELSQLVSSSEEFESGEEEAGEFIDDATVDQLLGLDWDESADDGIEGSSSDECPEGNQEQEQGQ